MKQVARVALTDVSRLTGKGRGGMSTDSPGILRKNNENQMKISKQWAMAAAFAFSTGTALANLGDTSAASIQKYGNPLSVESPVMNFRRGNYFIAAIFNGRGRCVFIKYVMGTPQLSFSEEQVKNIIGFNIDRGEVCTEMQTDGLSRRWQSKNVLACERLMVVNLDGSDIALDSISIGDKEGWIMVSDLK
jgi:hypothetical protein